MKHFDHIYPFSAIVSQEQMKKALILNAINPGIGGVLIRGEKGTASQQLPGHWRTSFRKEWWWTGASLGAIRTIPDTCVLIARSDIRL
jgi:hypothetical protein